MLMNWTLPVDHILTELLPRSDGQSTEEILVPRADVTDDGEIYQLVVGLPGVSQEGLSLEMEDDWLVVRGVRKPPEEKHLLANGRHAELPYAGRFALGRDIDRSQIKARLENGLLYVTLPRKEEEKPRRIEVQVG